MSPQRALFWDLGRVVRSSLMVGGVNKHGGVCDLIFHVDSNHKLAFLGE